MAARAVANTIKVGSGSMPVVGLGTWKAETGVITQVVQDAIEAGYRHLDCATDYGNEEEVGAGIKAALEKGTCKREDLWVTSKLWNTYHAKEHVRQACERTLKDLGLKYLDLYLIHFPIALKFVPFEKRYPPEWIHDPDAENPKIVLDPVPLRETWEAMEALVDAGLVRNIGVSNFHCQLVMDLLSYARIKPAVNQVELHPYLLEKDFVKYHKQVGVAVTAYSPLGVGSYVVYGADPEETVLKNPVINEIAKAHQRSPAQVVLRWGLQRGYAVIPKTTKKARLTENLSLFDFELTSEETEKIDALNRNRRYNDPGQNMPDPSWYYPFHA